MANAKLKQMAEVMLAAAEGGKIIQCRERDSSSNEWVEPRLVQWNWTDFEYRVKPEPREWFLVLNASGVIIDGATDRGVAEERAYGPGREVVLVREVLE